MSPVAILAVILSYLVGAIPFGILLSLGSGVDIRSAGSRNIGATNVSRLLGRKRGVLTLLLDVAKGFLPIYLASRCLPESSALTSVIALCGAASVLGHMFPVYLGFRGGKGVATALGVFLFLAPAAVLICLGVFLVVVMATGFVSAGSLLGSLSIVPAVWLLDEPVWKLVLSVGIVGLIWLKHHENITRLLNRTEKSWRISR